MELLAYAPGYNTLLVLVGAVLLGASAAAAGTFVVLRRRALTTDAVSHATLPGIGLAFLAMAAMGASGKFLPGLLLGAAISATIGLVLVDWIGRRTRLGDDAGIGVVLSSFYGFGVVLLTVIQSAGLGEPAGIGSFLLGSVAGTLFTEAVTIAFLALLSVFSLVLGRRVLTILCFDPAYAQTLGIDTRRTDLALMGLVVAVTVTGLKLVGLILIIALIIIPPVAARFWTSRATNMVWISSGIGAASGSAGVIASALGSHLPTGPLIVIAAAILFMVSFLFAPQRGILAGWYRANQFSRRVHRRQGLLALLRGEAVFDRDTIKVLKAEDLTRGDGVLTEKGEAAARRAEQEETLWAAWFRLNPDALARDAGLTLHPIEERLTRREMTLLRDHLAKESVV